MLDVDAFSPSCLGAHRRNYVAVILTGPPAVGPPLATRLAQERRMMSEHDTAEGFKGPQVCTIVGITYRQLDYWARTNLVRPSVHDAAGSGTQRRYSYRDLVEL